MTTHMTVHVCQLGGWVRVRLCHTSWLHLHISPIGNQDVQQETKETVAKLCDHCICPLPGCLCTPRCLLLQDSAANQENDVSRFAEGGQKRAISVWNITSSHSYSWVCNGNNIHGGELKNKEGLSCKWVQLCMFCMLNIFWFIFLRTECNHLLFKVLQTGLFPPSHLQCLQYAKMEGEGLGDVVTCIQWLVDRRRALPDKKYWGPFL